ncbi:hypothetical protein VKT23_020348 [Stygiomarasmius scandens]|uniref:Uncharacterized protein n=1 Tax=Marasmiellus scandens TaxID=2682957 RepID=A0ABR1IKH2_9AGAR
MSSTLRSQERLHALNNTIPRLTDDYLRTIHPPHTPQHFLSQDPALQALYLMLMQIWPSNKFQDLLECPTGVDGCIPYHVIHLNRQGQLRAKCELCCIDKCLPTLSVLEWAVLRDGLLRWEAQEYILSRTIDLTNEDTLTSVPSHENPLENPIDLTLINDSCLPVEFLCSIIEPPTPFWLHRADRNLRAIYTILSYIRPDIEREIVICPNPPKGCFSYHITSIDQGGRLYADCERCDVKSRCVPLDISDYYKVQSAFIEWIDQDEPQVEQERNKIWEAVMALIVED